MTSLISLHQNFTFQSLLSSIVLSQTIISNDGSPLTNAVRNSQTGRNPPQTLQNFQELLPAGMLPSEVINPIPDPKPMVTLGQATENIQNRFSNDQSLNLPTNPENIQLDMADNNLLSTNLLPMGSNPPMLIRPQGDNFPQRFDRFESVQQTFGNVQNFQPTLLNAPEPEHFNLQPWNLNQIQARHQNDITPDLRTRSHRDQIPEFPHVPTVPHQETQRFDWPIDEPNFHIPPTHFTDEEGVHETPVRLIIERPRGGHHIPYHRTPNKKQKLLKYYKTTPTTTIATTTTTQTTVEPSTTTTEKPTTTTGKPPTTTTRNPSTTTKSYPDYNLYIYPRDGVNKSSKKYGSPRKQTTQMYNQYRDIYSGYGRPGYSRGNVEYSKGRKRYSRRRGYAYKPSHRLPRKFGQRKRNFRYKGSSSDSDSSEERRGYRDGSSREDSSDD